MPLPLSATNVIVTGLELPASSVIVWPFCAVVRFDPTALR
jgi:hypothetical protein